MTNYFLSALLLATTIALVAAAEETVSPPAARTVDAVDEAFGLRLPDPYRWMEGEQNPEFAEWLKIQGEYGRARLDATPRLAFWHEWLDRVARAGVINRLQQPMGGRIFFLRLKEGREGVLMVRDRDGQERELLDPQAHKAGALTNGITNYSPSPDGRLIAVNVQHGGAEITDIRILSVADGKPIGETISDVWGEFQVNWLPDGRAFTYTQLAPKAERDPTDPILNERVRLHRLGSKPDSDPVLLARGTNPRVAMEPDEFPVIDAGQDSDQALLIIGGARPENRVCVAPRAEALRPDAKWDCRVQYADNVQQWALHRGRLYVTSMKGHPNGQILVMDVRTPDTVAATTVVLQENTTAVLTGLSAASDGLYVRRMQGGPDHILRLDYERDTPTPVDLPYAGAVYVMSTDPRAAGVLLTLQSWTQPKAAFLTSAHHAALIDLHLGTDSPGDYSGVIAEEVSARSADGTDVPLTIIHARGASSAHGEIAILEAYGGYGISLQPAFDPFNLEWVKAGHVYAIAHVRGGGEKGDSWRIEGSKQAKERGIEDFIACAENLVTRGWAGEGRVVAFGGSAGGIMIGGAITRKPTDFSAAVIQSGELNPSRLLAAKNGANQFSEIGDPRTSDGLHSVAAMDPYQRIKPNTPYPAVLLIVGLNDNRVVPWASGKFGARLMAANNGGRPVWFRTDQDMGHFNTAQAAQAREQADIFSFAELMSAK